jgi:hypothetical protein
VSALSAVPPHEFVAHCVKHGVPRTTLEWVLKSAREVSRQLLPMSREERYDCLRNHLLNLAGGLP